MYPSSLVAHCLSVRASLRNERISYAEYGYEIISKYPLVTDMTDNQVRAYNRL